MMRDVRALSNRCCETPLSGEQAADLEHGPAAGAPSGFPNPLTQASRASVTSARVKLRWAHRLESLCSRKEIRTGNLDLD